MQRYGMANTVRHVNSLSWCLFMYLTTTDRQH